MKIKKRILSILLAMLSVFTLFVGATNVSAQTVDSTSTAGILTASAGAKAEKEKLTFRIWVDKGRLSAYMQENPFSHTYYNVIIDGQLVEELGTSFEGLLITDWEYNLLLDDNTGYGYYDVVVDVSDKLTSSVRVVFGFTYYGQNSIDVWSDEVSYVGMYNSPNLSDLRLQMEFLEKELASQTTETIVNSEAYRTTKAELDRLTEEYNTLQADYDALQSEEKTRAIGLIVAAALTTLILLATSIIIAVFTLRADMHFVFKIIIILFILAALGAIGCFCGPQVYSAILLGI